MFYCRWVGTRNGAWIEAANMKSAKRIFAMREGIDSIARVTASRRKPV